jgi:hypothetical protein
LENFLEIVEFECNSNGLSILSMDHNQVFVVQYDLEKDSAFSSYSLKEESLQISVILSACSILFIFQVNVSALCKIFKSVQKGDLVTLAVNEIDGPLMVTIVSMFPSRQIR